MHKITKTRRQKLVKNKETKILARAFARGIIDNTIFLSGNLHVKVSIAALLNKRQLICFDKR